MPDPSQRCSINEDYWNAYIRHGSVWQRFSSEQRGEILAMPILAHDAERPGYREPPLAEIERRPEIDKLLRSIDCDPKLPSFHAVIRLMQVCHAAGDVFAPDRDPAELGHHLVHYALSRDAIDEFMAGRHTPLFYSLALPADTKLDLGRFASRGRLRSFLAIEPGDGGLHWENAQRQGSSGHRSLNLFSGKHVCRFARDILDRLIDAPGPVALADLLENLEFDSKQRNLVAKALRGLCQYVLTIAAYDSERADLVLGLWPELGKRLGGTQAPPPPAAKAPATTFVSPFLCADIAAILVRAASSPIRLKKQARLELYAAEERKLAAELEAVPSWVGDGLFAAQMRASVATFAAQSFNWLELERENFQFVTHPDGREWLSLAPTERLQQLLDRLRRARWGSDHWSPSGLNFSHVSGRIRLAENEQNTLACEDGITDAFGHAPVDEWIDTAAWLDHAARAHNPITAAVGAETPVMIPQSNRWRGLTWVKREAELIEDEARTMLESFLMNRLVPLGGAELGRGSGKSPVFRLTEIGRYYIGATREFPQADQAGNGRVIVQPNFEIMILGQNLLAEADLAAFCERTGEDSGAIFRITRKSVQQSLHKGGSTDEILATLRHLSDRDLPANVVTEIGGWSESRKTFRTRAATLLHCPDAAVAARLCGLLPNSTVPLTDTVLELTSPLTTPQRRKLEAAGLFQETDDTPAPAKPPARRRKRRGGWYP